MHGKDVKQAGTSKANAVTIRGKRIASQKESQQCERWKLFHPIPKREKKRIRSNG
jgi:hypothetical protein